MIKPFRKTLLSWLAALVVAQSLTACAPIAVGTATVTAIDLYQERRTLARNVDDNALEVKLRRAFSGDPALSESTNISVVSYNGIVLLTGEVTTDEDRQHAEAVARSFQDTRDVVNELGLFGSTTLTSRINDAYITAKVKTKLISNDNTPATSIKVVTERGTVYLLGVVTRQEADAAVKVTQTVRGVTRIVKAFEYLE